MGKRKKIIITAIVCIVALAAVLRLSGVQIRINPAYEGAMAVMCSGSAYEQGDGQGCLTILCDTGDPRPIRVRVEDAELQSELSGRDPSEIIGVHILYSVPYKVWSQNHVEGRTYNLIDEMQATGAYDQYLVLGGVSFDE